MGGVSRRGLLAVAAIGTGTALVPGAAVEATPAGPRLRLDTGSLRLLDAMADQQSWANYLADHDPVWRRLPDSIEEAPFLGNGGLGMALFRQPSRRAVRLEIGDSRVRDHQDAGGADFGQARLRVGFFSLETIGEVTETNLRLSLWHAELSGTISTTAGTIRLRCVVHATSDLLIVETTPDRGERGLNWSFTAYPAQSTRLGQVRRPAGLTDNPDPVVRSRTDEGCCVQDLAVGGGHATVWRTSRQAGTTRLIVSVAASYPRRTADTAAASTVLPAADEPVGPLLATHRAWWRRFYTRSFVSVPDRRLSAFYWIQLYKLACVTRADRPVVSSTAQWPQPAQRPDIRFDGHVQQVYQLINATGHDELDSLSSTLASQSDNLAGNVPAAYQADSAAIADAAPDDLRTAEVAVPGQVAGGAEVGNLTWALHNAWLSYRHSMDDRRLREVIYPLLRRAINYYLRMLSEGADGRLHLPPTRSPGSVTVADSNYDLALLTWGCRTLLAATDRLGLPDPLRARWREVLRRLVDPPRGSDGLWLGAYRPLAGKDDGLTHLLSFHPLHLLDPGTSTQRDLLRRSLTRWLRVSGSAEDTRPAAASLGALLGDGDMALGQLTVLMDRDITANTMRTGAGAAMATPLAAAQAMLDMLLHSAGGVLRVFPALPTEWSDVAVHNLRAEGGFLISAVRSAGQTRFVRVYSAAGERCRLAPGIPGACTVRPLGPGPVHWRNVGGGVLDLHLRAGDDVVVSAAGADPPLLIAPVPTIDVPRWGLSAAD